MSPCQHAATVDSALAALRALDVEEAAIKADIAARRHHAAPVRPVRLRISRSIFRSV